MADLGSYEPNYVKAFKAGAPKDPLGLRTKVSVWLGALLLVLASCTSCGEQQQYIPYVPVNFDIDLNLPAYNTLNFPGEAWPCRAGRKACTSTATPWTSLWSSTVTRPTTSPWDAK